LPLAPSICFICEGAPATERAIDTGRSFITHVPTKLTGRKYICESCAREFGKAIGLVDGSELDAARGAVEEAASRLIESELRVQQLEAVHVETLKELLAKATKPATRAVRVPKPVTVDEPAS
jgi:hypothetical protein